MHRLLRCAGFSGLLLWMLVTGCVSSSRPGRTGPWNVGALERVPPAIWGASTGLVQEVSYEGEPFRGRPTRVFAYLGRPATPAPAGGRYPGMVLVHGGGGKAFRDWAEHWARRGYVALAMDLAGNGPAGRLPDGGPDQSDAVKFRNFTAAETGEMWSYHAVSAVMLGHSLLRSLPEVDPGRTGLTGISWGGYLTCMVAGLDGRFRVAVPVYGCGYLGDNSYWKDRSLAAMEPAARELWLGVFDPSAYLPGVRCPILFLNGTTDFAYPLDSYQKSYRCVPERFRHVSVNVDLPHGHIWSFREVDVFVDSVLLGAQPGLVRLGAVVVSGGQGQGRVSAKVRAPVEVKGARFCYTTEVGPWQQRAWKTVPARLSGNRVEADLPAGRPLVGFLSVTDERGVRTSGEHFELQP